MIIITVGNSYSHIVGLCGDKERNLRKVLSYVIGGKSAFFSGYGPQRKSLLDKKGRFPTGLLPRVIKYLHENRHEFKIVDTFKAPATKNLTPSNTPPAYDCQLKALTSSIAHPRGIITMPTGTGKSRVIKMICENKDLRTLVVVPSLEIKQQLKASLKGLTNVTIENIDAKRLKTLTNFDCLIIDESHRVAAKTYHKLNKTAWTNIYYRYFLTATPFRNDDEEQLLFESIAGQVIYKLDYRSAIREAYIVPIDSCYYEVPKQATYAYTWAQVYSELVVNNDIRNHIIANVLLNLRNDDKSTLCLVKEVAHGQILSDITNIPFVNGTDNESRDYIQQFNSGRLPCLIGTEGIIGEGIDTRPCEYVVIAGLGKAKSAFMQKVGRGVRKYPGKESCTVILFRDTSHKFLLSHFNEQKKILKEEYSCVPLKL